MDLISRQAAIDAETHDKRTETHGVCLDTISRQAAIDALARDEEYNEDIPDRADGVRDAIITIMGLPSAQPKKGKWIYDYDKEHENPFFMQGWKCSACGRRQTYGEPPYCMYCGAEMEHSDAYYERKKRRQEQ